MYIFWISRAQFFKMCFHTPVVIDNTLSTAGEEHLYSLLRRPVFTDGEFQERGWHNLSLDRQTMTLSGGEAQRIKLPATLDSSLTGIIYIMDEPTIGLHPKDTSGIIRILKELRDLGNTVIVIASVL